MQTQIRNANQNQKQVRQAPPWPVGMQIHMLMISNLAIDNQTYRTPNARDIGQEEAVEQGGK